MPKVPCPSCGVALAVPEDSPETSLRCPGCQKVLRLNRRSRTAVQKPAVYAVPSPNDSAISNQPAAIDAQAMPPRPPLPRPEAQPMKCPDCGSENVQSLKMIYELGTSKIDTTSSGSVTGFGVGTGAGVAYGVTAGTTTGAQQTEAAKQAAPPVRKNFSEPGCVILMGIGVGLLSLVAANVSSLAAMLGFLSCATCLWGGGRLLWKHQKWNEKEWPKLHEKWLNSWRCLKCGRVFTCAVADEPAPTIRPHLAIPLSRSDCVEEARAAEAKPPARTEVAGEPSVLSISRSEETANSARSKTPLFITVGLCLGLVLLFATALGIGYILIGKKLEQPPHPPTAAAINPQSSNRPSQEVPVKVRVRVLETAYRTDQVAADLKYLDKTIELTEVDGKVDRDEQGRYFIGTGSRRLVKTRNNAPQMRSIAGAHQAMQQAILNAEYVPGVILYIKSADLKNFTGLDGTKPFTIRGQCKGSQKDAGTIPDRYIIVENCIFVEVTPVQARSVSPPEVTRVQRQPTPPPRLAVPRPAPPKAARVQSPSGSMRPKKEESSPLNIDPNFGEAIPAVIVIRRKEISDEDLRKQLLSVPEVGLDQAAAAVLYAPLSPTRSATRPPFRGRQSENSAVPPPDYGPRFLAERALRLRHPELAHFPWRQGVDCQLGKESSERLHVLSINLRTCLRAATPQGDVRPDPDKLRSLLLNGSSPSGNRLVRGVASQLKPSEWRQQGAIPALMQLLQAENTPTRLLLVELLFRIEGKESSVALANRALFDLSPEVREKAVQALAARPMAEYRQQLLDGFRYPWSSVSDHAAEALTALKEIAVKDDNVLPALIDMLTEPDPTLPVSVKTKGKKDVLAVRELVRISHLSNCMVCHAPSLAKGDLVRGRVPIPGEEPPPLYYADRSGLFIRADITYLRQDFSVVQPVANSGKWPGNERFDYLVRTRPLSKREQLRFEQVQKENPKLDTFAQREAVLYALRGITGKDGGESAPKWRGLLGIAKDMDAGLDKTVTNKTPPLDKSGRKTDDGYKIPSPEKIAVPKKEDKR